MYTHNPPEQFSLVTRAESTCVERCEPTKFEHPLPLRLKHIQVRECLGASRGSTLHLNPTLRCGETHLHSAWI
jgi:hypothetical protein